MTSADHIGYRPLGRGTPAGVLITVLLHGGLAGFLYWSQVQAPARPEAIRDLITTELVKLAPPRDKTLLPRVNAEPEVKEPEPEIKITEDSTKPPPPPPPKAKEPPKPKDDPAASLKRALDRAKRLSQAAVPEEPTEGDPSGSAEGTAAFAQQGNAYATAIRDALRKNWTAPTGLISEAELGKLSADVRVTIGPDGTLTRPTITTSSGNNYFDDSCTQAIKMTGRLPAPPPELRALFKRGLVIECRGKDLAP